MADLVILNAKVWTAGARQPAAEAVAVGGSTIEAVGSTAEIRGHVGRRTRVIDAAGRLVLPGFNDAHVHLLSGGFSLLGVNLRPARDERHLADLLGEHVAALPRGRWVTGGEWDHEAWPSRRHPDRRLIDGVTADHPALLRRLDGHISLANSLALRLAGVSRQTPDPAGGRIARDADGEPTGILVDTAQELVARLVPPPGESESLDAARAAVRHAARLGVTSVQTTTDSRELAVYRRLHEGGELSVRLYAIMAFDDWQETSLGPGGDAMLRTGGVKLFADGSLGAGSALLSEPYDDNRDSRGLAIHSQEELCRMVQQIDAAGCQVALHAIGDAAVRGALDAFERAAAAGGRRDSRHRVEHAQVVRPEDRERFARLGVVASVQPSHCTDDMRWIERRLGPRRCRIAYPLRSLLAAGARVAAGTDWPVEPLDPMLGLHAAAAREFPEGGPPGGWHPDEKVTMEEAIEAYTLGSAFAEFEETRKGSIEPGKLADMVIVSRDLLTIAPQEILGADVDATISGGKVVYER